MTAPQPFADCFFNRAGEPLTMDEWAVLCSVNECDYRQVAHDAVRGRCGQAEATCVSTVWTGIDLSFVSRRHVDPGADGPLVFETMVFSNHPAVDLSRQRYSTEEAAIKGHAQMCALVRLTLAEAEVTP